MDSEDKILVIGDEDAVVGFRLAGVSETVTIADGDAADGEKALLDAIAREDVGLVIVNAPLLAGLSEQTAKKIENLARPIIIAIPDRTGAGAESDSLRHMVKRALGVDLLGNKNQN